MPTPTRRIPTRRPSKSARKREAHDLAVARRGAGRAAAGRARCARSARDAARRRSSPHAHHEPRRRLRQRQYIGKLMRNVDAEPIRAALERRRDADRSALRSEHRIEHGATGCSPTTPLRGRARQRVAPGRARRRAARAGRDRHAPNGDSARPPAAARKLFRRAARACWTPAMTFRPRRMYNAAMKPLVGIIMGSTSDWETLQARRRNARAPRRAVRGARGLRASHARPAVRVRRHRARSRARGHHRRRRRRRSPARHDGGEDLAAGARRAGAVEGAERPRLAAVDRADAGRHSGRHARDRRRRRDQRGTARRRDPREQTPRRARRARAVPRRADRARCSPQPDPRNARSRT